MFHLHTFIRIIYFYFQYFYNILLCNSAGINVNKYVEFDFVELGMVWSSDAKVLGLSD